MKLTPQKITFVMAGFIAAIFIMLPIAAAVSLSFNNRLEEINYLLAARDNECPKTAEKMADIVDGTFAKEWSPDPAYDATSNVSWWRFKSDQGNEIVVHVKWGLIIADNDDHLLAYGQRENNAFHTTEFSWGCVTLDPS